MSLEKKISSPAVFRYNWREDSMHASLELTTQTWHNILPRSSSLRVTSESRPSKIPSLEMDEVLVFTIAIKLNIADNPYWYQYLHMDNCTRVSCSVQKLFWASCRVLVARRMRGLDHCCIYLVDGTGILVELGILGYDG
jgi:hypothetical protein